MALFALGPGQGTHGSVRRALKGDELCSVSVGSSDTIPGVSALEEAAGGTSDIPEGANAIIAKALGTVCNRLFKKGNTTPSFAGLSTATTTSAS